MTYKIATFGCAMNISDAGRIKTVMNKAGFKKSDKNPGVIIFVACSVRQSAIDRVWGKIKKQKTINRVQGIQKKPLIILTGCVLEEDRKKFENRVDILVDIKETEQLPKLILGHKAIKPYSHKNIGDNYFHISPKRNSKFSALVPIMTGCNNYCSYCAVPYTRGREYSRPVDEILKEVEELVRNGYKEIILLGQNVNSYRFAISNKTIKQLNNKPIAKLLNCSIVMFPALLKSINALKGDFWIRFFTSHPKDLSDELIKAMAECEKVCKYINLPVQAGDNTVLKKMNRKYTVSHYKKLIKKLKKAMPQITISTDIIVGFPGETEKKFENSAKLFREIKYDMAYIAQFSPRAGTAAARLKDNVTREEKKRREKALTEILKKTALKNNMVYKDTVQDVLVEKKLKNGKYLGKTGSYKHVQIANNRGQLTGNRDLIGEFIQVKINDVGPWGLKGKV
ncbi:MAG: tRNA (N6-isopentenyl adenosine(37)-C2)-methylthiotransferase MiaB [Candidatus Kuenenbacteria bacterium]